MNNIKFFTSVFVMITVLLSCSFWEKMFSELKEEIGKEESPDEKTNETTSLQDIIFYNKYLEISRNISSAVDNIQKGYLSIIPDPKKVNRNSFIMMIGPEIQLGFLETTLKNYKRAFYDDGELSKLEVDNSSMEHDLEESFEKLIPAVEDYVKTARKVVNYYKDNEYKNNLSKAVQYDAEIKQKYEEYEFLLDVYTEMLNKYKPEIVIRNPDDYTDPDEKVVIIIQNALEKTSNKAESFHEMFKDINNGSDVAPVIEELSEFEKTFKAEQDKVMSAEYSEVTKYMKYSFEDYFSKTVKDFITQTDKFLDSMKRGKLNDLEFKTGYDIVILYYNLMVTAYNSTLITINSFQTYK
ncbi:MAG: hypothetical protein H8D45_03645 [Bacteroidetes bacterium]|nr:hypothetical protein [Bacteroidota bacterium]